MQSRKVKTPLANRMTINFAEISNKHPFGKVERWSPINPPMKQRTLKQIRLRLFSFIQKLSRKINRKK